MTTPRLLSVLISMNLRLGMPDRKALEHAQGMADLLAEHRGGESLYIGRPSPRTPDAKVASLRAKGASVRRIAREVRMSRSWVHKSLRRQGLAGPVHGAGVTVDAATGDALRERGQ